MSPITTATHVPLQRLVSKLGMYSRTQAANMIREGRVRVDGQTMRDPSCSAPRGGLLHIDSMVTHAALPRVLTMHKKRGVLTASTDERGTSRKGAPLVNEVVCDHSSLDGTGCMPVGRPDRASEGLLFFTNDTQLAHRLTSPESHLEKDYFVRVLRPLDSDCSL